MFSNFDITKPYNNSFAHFMVYSVPAVRESFIKFSESTKTSHSWKFYEIQ